MAIVFKILMKYFNKREKNIIVAIKNTKYEPMKNFSYTLELCEGILDYGTKMGEGWLLTSEMVELVQTDYENIICSQPFGCLPNHICGKGVKKKLSKCIRLLILLLLSTTLQIQK